MLLRGLGVMQTDTFWEISLFDACCVYGVGGRGRYRVLIFSKAILDTWHSTTSSHRRTLNNLGLDDFVELTKGTRATI